MVAYVGLVSPGEMGAAVAQTLTERGIRVLSELGTRSESTRRRASAAGITDVHNLEALVQQAELVLSIVPPASASEVAGAVAGAVRATGSSPVFVDANAVSPSTAAGIQSVIEDAGASFVDADLIGSPPAAGRQTSFYCSGDKAGWVADVLNGPLLRAVALDGDPTAASALKMCYAAYTKGGTALLIAIRALARSTGVEGALLEQWEQSQPGLASQSEARPRHVARLAWRYSGELDEIARSFADAGLPDGFGAAAAEIYRRQARFQHTPGQPPLDDVLAAVLNPSEIAPD